MDFISDQTVSFIEDIQKTETKTALQGVLEKTLGKLGVKHFTLYEFTGSTEVGVLGNYPTEWGGRYAEKRYEYLDPVALKLFRERKGFRWSAKDLDAEGFLDGGSGKVFHEGSDFGLREGYAYLFSDMSGRSALTSFCAEKIERDPKMLPAMHLISLYLHGKFKELTADLPSSTEVARITARERECLRWAGLGKTNWEIAKILGVKETTIQSHVENAKRKLNVQTRVELVVRSMQTGVIHL
jgi:LuxR family quorum sensing-dependent transcriptional regulator